MRKRTNTEEYKSRPHKSSTFVESNENQISDKNINSEKVVTTNVMSF
jgi:hypothetical protein